MQRVLHLKLLQFRVDFFPNLNHKNMNVNHALVARGLLNQIGNMKAGICNIRSFLLAHFDMFHFTKEP